MKKIVTRMGDGYLTDMTESELKKDLENGTTDASHER